MVQLSDRFQVQVLRALGASAGWLSTSQGRMHVIDVQGRGALPPVCLLHGLSAAGADYTPLIQALRPHVKRILALDMPGHGLSDVPPDGLTPRSMHLGMLEALDRALDTPMVLYGNSMGGLAATRYAARRPHRVTGLVLSSPAGAPMDTAALRGLVESFLVDSHAEARRFIARAFAAPHPLRPVMAMGFKARTARPALRNLLANLSPADLLAADEVAGLRMPVLLQWGTEEAVLPRDHLAFWRSQLPEGSLVEEPAGHGHAPFVTHTDEVTTRIVSFVRAQVLPWLAAKTPSFMTTAGEVAG